VCAIADTDFRRTASFGTASVLATILFGIATGDAASPAIVVGLLGAFVAGTTAIFLSGDAGTAARGRRGSIGAIVLLFSGLCGQAWLLGTALDSLFAGTSRGTPALLLAVLLTACAQYLSAAALMRSLGSIERPDATVFAEVSSASLVRVSPNRSVGSAISGLLTALAVAVPLVAAFRIFRAAPAVFSASALGYAGLGLIPGLGGLVAGAQSARAEWKIFPGDAVDGLLMRLGRSAFYFDAFLFLFVLVPLRGVAGLARFVDWALVDTVATGGPASLYESAAAFFGPLQYRGVFFYLFSAVLGTVVLSMLMIWLRG
jgi:hypothetical protein